MTFSGSGFATFTPSGGTPVAVTNAYPLTIAVPVGAITGSITSVSVELDGLSTNGAFPDGLTDYSFLLISPDGKNLDFANTLCSKATSPVIFTDSATAFATNGFSNNCTITSSSDQFKATNQFADTWPTLTSINQAPPFGSANNTFGNLFSGAAESGSWKLYVSDQFPQSGSTLSMTGWKLTIFYNATQSATTTTLASNNNPSFTAAPNNAVTFTTTVTSAGGTVNSGTVAFNSNGNTISGCGAAPVSNGSATCSTSFGTQGNYSITANYSGGGNFGASSTQSPLIQSVTVHTTNPSGNKFCNAGTTTLPTGGAAGGPSVPYPSLVIVPATVTGTINTLAVDFTSFTANSNSNTAFLSFELVDPNGRKFEFWSGGGAPQTLGNVSFVFADGGMVLTNNTALANNGIYAPVTNAVNGVTDYPGADKAATEGPATFLTEFAGRGAAGTWSLYANNYFGTGGGSYGWCVDFGSSLNSGQPTNTAVASSKQTAFTSDTVTITATVTPNPGSGLNVTFSAGTTPLGTGTTDVNGKATYTINPNTLAQSTYLITAEFSGSNNFGASSGTIVQRIDAPPPAPAISGNVYTYCNTGQINFNSNLTGGTATPYPSNIYVANLPGTMQSVSATLKNWGGQLPNFESERHMLIGPTGSNFVFYAEPTNGNNYTNSPITLTFEDSATSRIGTALTSGSFQPTATETTVFSACPTDVPSCGTIGPAAPTSGFNYAATQGSATFLSIFGGGTGSTVNANGEWSLFIDNSGTSGQTPEDPGNISGGWCLNFTQNPPVTSITKSGPTTVTAGQGGYQYTINVTNNGPGPTGGAITLTEVPSAGLTVTGLSSTDNNWACAGTTCNYSADLAQGASAGALTATISVAANAAASQSNKATVTGGGTSGTTSSNTLAIAVVSPTTTTAANVSANFSSSAQNVTLSATVTSPGGTVNNGSVSFSVLQSGSTLGSPVSGNVSNGSASANFSIPAGTVPGSYTIVATYNPGAGFSGSSDSTHSLTINAAGTTTLASNVSTTFSTSSQTVTLSATVTSGAGTVNSGSVTFAVAGIGTPVSGNVTNGQASAQFTIPAGSAPGAYPITATYNPGTGFTGSSDNTHVLTINTAGTTTTASNASTTFSTSSQTVTLSATVTSGAGTVNSGSVTFAVAGIGTPVSGNVTNGQASAQFTIPAGSAPGAYPITATYNPGTGFTVSSDNTHTLTINTAGTTTLASNVSTTFSTSSQTVTLSATVTSGAGTVSSGSVTFAVNGIGTPVTGSVSNGQASAQFTIPAGTSSGSYAITATYNPGVGFSGSSDNTHSLTISSSGTSIIASNAAITYSASGQSVTLSALVTSNSGTVNSGTVTFSVSGVGTPTTSGTVTNGSASVNFTIPGGTFAGVYPIVATYTPGPGLTGASDNTHSLTVLKASPVLSWTQPASIVYGSALGAGQLDAASNVPGTFTYSPAAGTVLPTGTNEPLSASFTPTDTVDYNTGTVATTITVTAAGNGTPANLIVQKTLSRDMNNNVVVTLTIANNGGTTADNVTVTSLKVGSTAGTPLPQGVGSVAAGSSASASFTIPNSSGLASGSASSLTVGGTYTGGTFSSSARITLP